MERKRRKGFVDCPNCKDGWHVFPVWGSDGTAKCCYCKGFGLMSVTDRIQYHDDTQLTLNLTTIK